MTTTETIEWIDARQQMPDADTTVLIILGGEVEAYVGFTDGVRWYDGNGTPCEVVWWAHLPEGPRA